MVLLPGCKCCGGGCELCQVDCCGDEYPRQEGECCEGKWRMPNDGVCCGGVWYPAGTAGQCCGGVWQTGEGVCCGGVWQIGDGDCCGGTWYAAGVECEEGHVYLRWGDENQCCGCLPDQIFDCRVNDFVNTADVVSDLCCGCSGGIAGTPIFSTNLLPYVDMLPGVPGHCEFRGCVQRCCHDGICTDERLADCDDLDGVSLPSCCNPLDCPKPCCEENADGIVDCGIVDSGLCVAPRLIPESGSDCTNGCLGECCIDGISQGQTTQADCDALGGQFAGLGSTSCQGAGKCRSPFTESCCEHKVSSAAGLTFTQPRRKRTPPFTGTLEVTVTGTTDSRILIHGTPLGVDADPPKRCPINHTFLLCWDKFNVEPVPCGSNFINVDLTVCWKQVDTTAEQLAFPLCDDITVWLGYCPYNCTTTLIYTGGGDTSDSTIVLLGDAVVDAVGGPLVFSGDTEDDSTCDCTFTLTGASTANNQYDSVIPNSGSGNRRVVKDGIGTWWLTQNNSYGGRLTVRNGKLVAGATVSATYGTPSPFGTYGSSGDNYPIVGNDDAGVAGTAALLLADGVSVGRQINVAALGGGASQIVVLGGFDSGTSAFAGDYIWLGRDVTLQAATGGTVTFEPAAWQDGSGGANPTAAFTIGSSGNAGTVVFNANIPASITGFSVVQGTARLATSANRIRGYATPVSVGAFTGNATLDIAVSQTLENITFPDNNGSIINGTLRLSGSPASVAVQGTGHQISSAVVLVTDATFTVDGGCELTVSGVISGSYGITLDGGGTLTLSAANTYTGGTTVNGGTLALSGTLDATSTVSVGAATLACSGSTKSVGGLVLTGAATITGSLTAGTLSGSGSLIKSGSGTLLITGSNTMSGNATISGGSFVVEQIVSGPALVTSATFTPSSLTVAFSADPASGDEFQLLPGETINAYSSPTLTGTTATGTYDSSTSTLTID